MGINIYILKRAKRKARRYMCRVKPLSNREREFLKQRIIIELAKSNNVTDRHAK